MANSKNVVWFMIYHPLNRFKFKGNLFTHSSLRSPSRLVEVGTGITTVASFHSTSCSSRRRSIFHRITNRDDALKLFHEITHRQPLPPVARFNELLQAVTKKKHYSSSVEIFQRMNSVGAPIDALTISIVTKCLCQMHHTEEGSQSSDMATNVVLHLMYLLKGHFKDSLYAEEAIRLLHKMSEHGVEPNVSTYNTVLEGLFKVGCCSLGVQLFNEMFAHSDLRLNIITYMIVLEGLCDNNKVDKALSLFHLMGDDWLNSQIPVYNILIDGASKSGKLDIARTLFKELSIKGLKPDDRTYTVMINGCCLQGVGVLEEANQLFLEMKEKGFLPKTRSYNLLIQGFLKNEQRDIAETLIQEMKESGLKLDEDTKSLLHAQDGLV